MSPSEAAIRIYTDQIPESPTKPPISASLIPKSNSNPKVGNKNSAENQGFWHQTNTNYNYRNENREPSSQ